MNKVGAYREQTPASCFKGSIANLARRLPDRFPVTSDMSRHVSVDLKDSISFDIAEHF